MNDAPIDWRRGDFVVSTDRGRIDAGRALALLRETSWGGGLTLPVLRTAIAHSVCFGLYRGKDLHGLARVVTDLATYGYLTDVVVAEESRGLGLGRFMMECVLEHPRLQGFRRMALLTLDAAGLYAALGFTEGPGDLTYMERR
ncbi:MAG TPA: GNAT family N-acetyltransferase [Candidatus Sulfotelmatobacter sp.]|nr:GNAT family N-acetyltransferase [Candidatus Sulfotelmatobacter sp.]